MESKRLLKLLGVIVLAAVIAIAFVPGCAAPASTPGPEPTPVPTLEKAETFVLMFLTGSPWGAGGTRGARNFVNLVNNRAQGELVLVLAGSEEAMKVSDQAEALTRGVVDMVFHSCDVMLAFAPELMSRQVSPFTLAEEREVGLYDFYKEKCAEAGIYLLGMSSSCSAYGFNIYSNVKLEGPEDLAGLRFRGGIDYDCALEALDIASVTMGMGDVYTALQRGVIDGYIFPWDAIIAFGLPEVSPYAIDVTFWNPGNFASMNPDSFNSLPKHLQDLLIDCAIENELWCDKNYPGLVEKDFAVFKEQGMEFVEWSPEGAQEFLDIVNEAKWGYVKSKVSAESYATLREIMAKK